MAQLMRHNGAMDVSPFVNRLEREIAALAPTEGADGEDVGTAAVRLDAAIRRAFVDVLTAAAAEINRDLGRGAVEVRLDGDDPDLVVTRPPCGNTAPSAESPLPCPAARRGKRRRQRYTAWVR